MPLDTVITRKAVFILPPKVHLLDITGPAHIFYEAADYGASVELIYASMFTNNFESVSSGALGFRDLLPFDQVELTVNDVMFIPGLDSTLLLDAHFIDSCFPFFIWLRGLHQRGILVCSVCTGAFLLAAAGLLDGISCTTHWKYAERFRAKFPKARLLEKRLFVREANICTSAGVSSGIDLALYLVSEFWGPYFAAQIAKEVVVYFRRGEDDLQLSAFSLHRNHLDNRIHIVQDKLSRSMEKKLVLGDLAELISMSSRNLTRLFKTTTGVSIGAYLAGLRRERASQLIKEGETMQAAALACGLKSTNQLRQLLK